MSVKQFFTALLLSFFSVQLYAACSDAAGKATINEVYKLTTGGGTPSFIEIKVLDNDIGSAVYDEWTIQICSSSGCSDYNVSDFTNSFPWLYISSPTLDDSEIDFQDGFTIVLKGDDSDNDGLDSQEVIDYLVVEEYSTATTVDGCTVADLPYNQGSQVTDTVNGTKEIRRNPDGTGDWTVIEANNPANEETEGDNNSGSSDTVIAVYQFEQVDFTTNIEDSSGLANHGSNDGGIVLGDGKYCQGFDTNGTNSSSSTENGFDSNLDLDTEIGVQGHVSFWFKSHVDWDEGGNRTLFDASSATEDKYFYLELQSDGTLRVKLEDSNDDDYEAEESSGTVRVANRWYYISVNWDLPSDSLEIFVDGVSIKNSTINTDGKFGDLGNLFFGDNASSYLDASPVSANGVFDEVRIYSQTRSLAEINAAMVDTSCAVEEVRFEFDEGSGQSVADFSGNGRNGTLGSSTSSDSNDPSFTCTATGYQIDFDATNNERITTSAFTPPSVGGVSFWLKTSAIPTSIERVFGFGDGWEARWDTDGHLYFDINKTDTNTTIGTSSPITATDTWMHFTALTDADNNTWAIYIDGVLDNSGSEALTAQSDAVLTLGGSTWKPSSEYFNGSLDDFRIFSGTLTAGKIAALAETAPTPCIEELAYFSFEQIDLNTQVTDFSGSNNHGSNQGGAVTSAGKYCQAFDSDGENNSSSSSNAFNSGLDLDDDVGIEGTISFWYSSNEDWGTNSEERVLFDASSSSDNKYFYLLMRSTGELAFKFEDENDDDLTIDESTVVSRYADTWYYITVTWNLNIDVFQLYVDGVLVEDRSESDDGAGYDTDRKIGELGDLYFGDNSPNYSGSWQRSIDGKIDEVRIYDEVLTQERIQAAMLDDNCAGGVNHYQISHDYFGLTCDTEYITVKACTNAYDGTCTQSSTQTSVDIVVTGQDTGDTDSASTIFTGNGTAAINYINEENVVISLTNPSITPSNATVCNDNRENSCIMAFQEAGFQFLYDGQSASIDSQEAGVAFSATFQVRAVKNSKGVCAAALNGNKTIQMAQQNILPDGTDGLSFTVNDTGGDTVTLNKYDPDSPTIVTDVDLTFSSGIATISNATYFDAGHIRLWASYNQGSIDIVGSSPSFWVAPSALEISAQSGGSDIDGNTSTHATTHKAGESFDLTVTAVNAQGNTTVNYTPSNIQLQLTRTGPTGSGVDGELTYASGATLTSAESASFSGVNLTSFINGVSSFNSASYDEVGLINLDVRDNNYASEGIVVDADAIDIGRFTPDHFALFNSTVNNTLFAASTSYMGQAFGVAYQIDAQNAANKTTENYIGAYNTAVVTFHAENNSNGTDLGSRLSGFGGASWEDGSLLNPTDSGAYDTGVFSRLSAAVDGPYESILYGLNVTDNDGTLLTNRDMLSNSAKVFDDTANKMRFARLFIDNAYGPETASLPVPMQIQYYNGSDFVTDSDNSTTSYDSADMTVTDVSLGSTPALSGSGTFSNGTTTSGNHVMIASPGSGNQGAVTISYSSEDWLKFDWDNTDSNSDGPFDDDPSATANFGIYRGNDRIIYWRELH